MPDRYAVFGNPVEHSRSPEIHEAFAAQRGESMDYRRIHVPLDDFAGAVRAFVDDGGRGANVTLPFKEEAFALCEAHSERARRAGAVNTLLWEDSRLYGDNTDGPGLVTDIRDNLGWSIRGSRLLLLGAGGAVRGALAPLLAEQPQQLVIANRTLEKAMKLADDFADLGATSASGFAELRGPFDLVINATSTALQGGMPDLPEGILAKNAVAYDMVYANEGTPFMHWAAERGAATSDGFGMLVEQAAESFLLWHGWRPETQSVIRELR